MDAQAYPIVRDPAPKPGIFRTFHDFRDNTGAPEDAYGFTLEEETNKKNPAVRAIPTWERNYPPDGPIWGISDGRHVYVRLGRTYHRLEREGDDYVFWGLDPDAAGNNAMKGVMVSVIVGEAFSAEPWAFG